jgi:IS30 family transposase
VPVERTSLLVLLAKMEDKTRESTLASFSAKLNPIIAPLRQSFTYEQGKEVSRHKKLAAATNVNIYFCDPHSPRQRGSCENTNRLLRQYLHKGTHLPVDSQGEFDAIAHSLNSHPRVPFAIQGRRATLASANQQQGSKR